MPKSSPTKKSRLRPSWRVLGLLLLGFCIPLLAYVAYLDRVVVSQFEGKRFSLPARVYAQPLELYPNKTLSATRLNEELSQLNYAERSHVTQAGEFKRSGATFELYTRPFTYWDGDQDARHVRVFLHNGRISKIVDIASNIPLDLLRLDPIKIGGIYPNQGEDRILVRLQQVPPALINALIATEDRRFYQHHGIDPKAILRAFATLFTSNRVQGGSTLTQQLVKNFYLTRERTIRRKVKEMMMALLLEMHYSKNDILETYLNEVYFGQDRNRAIHGFGLASQFYFSRSIEHIELHQAALLVGLLKGPVYYNPRKHSKRAKARRNLVLAAMHDEKFISDREFQQASEHNIEVSALPNRGQSPYPAFLDLVVRQLKRDYREADLRSEGLRIFTSLDPYAQSHAEKSLRTQLAQLEQSRKLPTQHLQGSVVLINIADGEVVALVGDRNTGFQGFNRALDASRQIGSLIKPAIYLTALEQPQRYNLTSPLDDDLFIWNEPGISEWQPQNYDKQFHGEVPLWRSLALSYNVAAARLGTELGVDRVMATARRLGIEKTLPNYASGLLGTVHLTPLEVAQMYHTIASGGFRTPFRAIREVTTMHGEPLNRYPLKVSPAVDPSANYLLTRGLQEVVSHGTAAGLSRYIDKNINAAGKTGTTDELRDSWFAGFTGDKVGVVWIGNDKNESVKLTGASGALKVWGQTMAALSPQPLKTLKPENIVDLGVDATTGFLLHDNCHNTRPFPFHQDSINENDQYCGQKRSGKIKSWFKNLFNR